MVIIPNRDFELPKMYLLPDRFRLAEDWLFNGFLIPEGFYTDLETVPNLLRSIIHKQGVQSYPAIKHDYLYTYHHGLKREEVDKRFKADMEKYEVDALIVEGFYTAVRAFGGSHWTNGQPDFYSNNKGTYMFDKLIPKE